jgi:hypothetical protein
MLPMGPHVKIVEAAANSDVAEVMASADQPVLFKGYVTHWPAVQFGAQSTQALIAYLKSCDNGVPANTLLGDPAIKGAFFYGDATDTFNFRQGRVPISVALDRICEQARAPDPYAVYVQSSLLKDHLPAFATDNRLDVLDEDVEPRIWIGNQVRVQTHYDLYDNMACLVAGKRRFTLFPPEQLVNLYPGPPHKTLAGTPVSMASLDTPDFKRFPRLKAALDKVQHADLEPGDALFIPYFWWHHVSSRQPFNVLVNYWWDPVPDAGGSPYDALLHAALALKGLSPRQRSAWRTVFDYYIFESHGDPVSHLAETDKSAMGAVTPDVRAELFRHLIRNLQDRA